METMRFIHVGVGGFGGHWVNVLKDEKRAKVVALVDINKQALLQACDNGGYSQDICFSTLKEALKKVEADAVVVSTPPKYHRPPVVEAMRAGLDVISEKPMDETLVDCKAMLKEAKSLKRTYMVSQNYRYTPQMWTLADIIRKGSIGKVGQVKIDFFMGHDFHGGFRHDMPYPLLIDMSIHHFDLIRFITGLNPIQVRGEAWNPSWSNYKGDCSSNVVFEMQNHARIIYSASWCAKGQFCDWNGNWHIEGSKGTLIYHHGNIEMFDAPNLYQIKNKKPVTCQKMDRTAQSYILDEFIKCVKSRKRPATDVFDNIRSISMVFAAV